MIKVFLIGYAIVGLVIAIVGLVSSLLYRDEEIEDMTNGMSRTKFNIFVLIFSILAWPLILAYWVKQIKEGNRNARVSE